MSAAALKVALSFSGELFTRALTYRIWQISPQALECVRENARGGIDPESPTPRALPNALALAYILYILYSSTRRSTVS